MTEGLYEELITSLIDNKLRSIGKEKYYINTVPLDKAEASLILSRHIASVFKKAFDRLNNNDIEQKIKLVNSAISHLSEHIINEEFEEDLVAEEGKLLNAVFKKLNADFGDLELHLKQITPLTRLAHSELFTGGNVGLSLVSEIKKEIQSADEIDLLVSFIKFKGVIVLERELKEFTERGGTLRILTTTYMGASDYKAIRLLSKLKNTQVKISYNTGNERLHAKAYLFKRNTGYHTGYIGSSNFSRSALTDGLEWNIKITTKEISHIIDKFQKTFESYWASNDFELFDNQVHQEKLRSSLKSGSSTKLNFATSFFDIKPYPYQEEILEKLEVERSLHNRHRNLLVAATGTGKTVISAFDYERFKKSSKTSKLLFLAHRKEILLQARSTFQGVLKDNNFGELWVDGHEPNDYKYVFASVQTLKNRVEGLELSEGFYDFIIIDECHHQKASSYRGILNYFKPRVLLGLTATPERMDNEDITEDFHHRIAAEIRLPQALNRKLLCPFQYFGITDSVDLSEVNWVQGKYQASELTKLYVNNSRRVSEIINTLEKYTKDINEVRALGFCVTIEHAKYMSEQFSRVGLKSSYLTSDNSKERELLSIKLKEKTINYLFVVDIFNEGVDIPEIDTVLFLRPTESLTVFLQQLGRGLRLSEDKDVLTVLDFVGNARPEYNFDNKFRALIGKTSTSVKNEVENDFPHLPLGCSIVLEQKTKEIILQNITTATSLTQKSLINKIRSFRHNTSLELNLKNFIHFYNLPLQKIYARGSWSKLNALSTGKEDEFSSLNEKEFVSTVLKKWLSTRSASYFKFLLKLARNNFSLDNLSLSKTEKQMLIMLYYDFYTNGSNHNSLREAIKSIGDNRTLVTEMIELLEILIDELYFKELDILLPYTQPLKVHSRYTRDQILAAFGLSTFEKKSSNREGVAINRELNTEILFINLIKSEEDFSPTTMYEDYAINETLFHWQSQNSAGPLTPKGKSYINHIKEDKKILLFVREQAKDEYGNTMGYVFIGEARLKEHYGSKPMSIKWQLEEPLPHYLWNDAAKMVAG